jgi:hypothetical protein
VGLPSAAALAGIANAKAKAKSEIPNSPVRGLMSISLIISAGIARVCV